MDPQICYVQFFAIQLRLFKLLVYRHHKGVKLIGRVQRNFAAIDERFQYIVQSVRKQLHSAVLIEICLAMSHDKIVHRSGCRSDRLRRLTIYLHWSTSHPRRWPTIWCVLEPDGVCTVSHKVAP